MLSIVIPCYNEGQKLVNNIKKVNEYMDNIGEEYEIIVVNDGSKDNTLDILTENNHLFKHTKIVTYPINKGKGFAVKTGLLEAVGDYVIFMDADLSTDLSAIKVVLEKIQISPVDIIIGNRRGENSKEENKGFIRHLMSWGCHVVTVIFTGVNFVDTQCGFKALKNNVAKHLASKQKIERFAFDIEYLYIAKLHNYSVIDIPVIWENDKDSKVRIVRDTIRFFKDVVKIRLNKKYYL